MKPQIWFSGLKTKDFFFHFLICSLRVSKNLLWWYSPFVLLPTPPPRSNSPPLATDFVSSFLLKNKIKMLCVSTCVVRVVYVKGVCLGVCACMCARVPMWRSVQPGVSDQTSPFICLIQALSCCPLLLVRAGGWAGNDAPFSNPLLERKVLSAFLAGSELFLSSLHSGHFFPPSQPTS